MESLCDDAIEERYRKCARIREECAVDEVVEMPMHWH